MANNEEDVQSTPTAKPMGMVDTTDPNIRNFFANDVHVTIGESDIALLFSYSFWDGPNKVSTPGTRIILSHTNFVRMMEFLETRAKVLRRIYNGTPPDILSGDINEVRLAFEELHNAESNVPAKE